MHIWVGANRTMDQMNSLLDKILNDAGNGRKRGLYHGFLRAPGHSAKCLLSAHLVVRFMMYTAVG
jgi:hypothetical protein